MSNSRYFFNLGINYTTYTSISKTPTLAVFFKYCVVKNLASSACYSVALKSNAMK